MNIRNLPIEQIIEAPWNPNFMGEEMFGRLRRSFQWIGQMIPLVVRQIEPGLYETIGGAKRLAVLNEMKVTTVPVVIVDADDVEARLLCQALNCISGDDDLGMRAQLMREVLETPVTRRGAGAAAGDGREYSVPSLLGPRRTWPPTWRRGSRHRQPG